MKTKKYAGFAGALIALLMIVSLLSNARGGKSMIKRYLAESPSVKEGIGVRKYRMTATYINRDLYGNFIDKSMISGDYTKGLENGFAKWNNVSLSDSKNLKEPFSSAVKLDYIENFRYLPSSAMLSEDAFKAFPSDPPSVLAKNLIWDMMAIEEFAFDHSDSLKLNKVYRIPVEGQFNMADIGTYDHAEIQLCRTGISLVNDELCAVIDYRAPDNKISLSMPGLKTKGTEQYWGTVWVSLKTGELEQAVMFGGVVQELEVTGVKDKFLIRTVRDLQVEKIQ